jgi:glycosyltransferase involved in cell wall biosynthesis
MRVFGWSDGQGGVFHYRIKEPLRGLRLRGHRTETGQALQLKTADRHDVILVRALHNPHESKGWMALAEQGNHLLVYDLDDDVWAWHPTTNSYQYWNDQRRLQVEINIQIADLVTTPSIEFARILQNLNPNVKVLPNTVPRWLTSIAPLKRDVFVVGWEGAHQHLRDLQMMMSPLFRFMVRHRDVQLWLWGPDGFADLPPGLADRVKCFPWQSDVPSFYRSLAMDVALAPLEDQPFNETKSAIRVQVHSALGHPIIASSSLAHVGYLQPGVNGFYADREGDWEDCLEALYTDRSLRELLARGGRELAKRHWTTEGNAVHRELLYQDCLDERNQDGNQAKGRGRDRDNGRGRDRGRGRDGGEAVENQAAVPRV